MSLKRDIENTIEYAAKFGSYINKKEIEQRLISKKIFSKGEILNLLEQLDYKGKKNRWYEKKFNKAVNLVGKIKKNFKNILFLGISGSVASGHPKMNDDIDFLIITKSNKLWITRLKIRWWIYRNNIPHRKYGKKEGSNEFCFNLWLDENYLLLPKTRRNLRNAVDLILLKPLINKNQTYEKFLLTNSWAKKWVATPYFNKIQDVRFKILDKKIEQNNFDKIINYLYFWPQYWYMKKKIGKESVSLYQAFFHR